VLETTRLRLHRLGSAAAAGPAAARLGQGYLGAARLVFSKLCQFQWLFEHTLMVIRAFVFQASVAAMLLASTGRLRAQRRIR
jgi:hypothetical protein